MLQRKTINAREGFRIASSTQKYFCILPANSRYDTFRLTIRAAISVSGHSQLTFDNREDAERFLREQGHYYIYPSDALDWHVAVTRNTYTCIKVPVTCASGDVIDAWIAESELPTDHNSEHWRLLVQLYPEYFSEPHIGFFENLNEDKLNEDVSFNPDSFPTVTEDKIKDVMENESLSEDQKCVQLWERPWNEVELACRITVNHFYGRYLNDEQKRLRRSDDVSRMYNRYYHNSGCHTVLSGSSYGDTLNLTQSYERYVKSFQTTPMGWWRDICWDIENAELSGIIQPDIRKPYKRGFFGESLNLNEEFTATEIKDIVEDNSLTEDEKCEKLWGFDFDTIKKSSQLSYDSGWANDNNLRFTRAEIDAIPEGWGLNIFNYSRTIDGETYYNISHYPSLAFSVFYVNHDVTGITKLKTSYQNYGNHDYYKWWFGIDINLKYWINKGKIHKPYKLGFFTEDLSTDQQWLRDKFGMSENRIKLLCDWNWEKAEDNNCYWSYWSDAEGNDGGGICNPYFDSSGVKEFDSISEVIEYYGKNWLENFFSGLINFAAEKGVFIDEPKPKHQIGFF